MQVPTAYDAQRCDSSANLAVGRLRDRSPAGCLRRLLGSEGRSRHAGSSSYAALVIDRVANLDLATTPRLATPTPAEYIPPPWMGGVCSGGVARRWPRSSSARTG